MSRKRGEIFFLSSVNDTVTKTPNPAKNPKIFISFMWLYQSTIERKKTINKAIPAGYGMGFRDNPYRWGKSTSPSRGNKKITAQTPIIPRKILPSRGVKKYAEKIFPKKFKKKYKILISLIEYQSFTAEGTPQEKFFYSKWSNITLNLEACIKNNKYYSSSQDFNRQFIGN